MVFSPVFFLTALIGVGSAWLFRGGLFLQAFGVEVITKNGESVPRLRALWRGLISWAPVIIASVLLVPNPIPVYIGAGREVAIAVGGCAGALFVVGAAWAVVHPERGVQDRIAGTYLVPR